MDVRRAHGLFVERSSINSLLREKLMSAPANTNDNLKADVIVYFAILALFGLQVALAYQNAHPAQLLARMLAVALIQAGLAVMYFMHLRSEQRNLRLALIPATIFVMLMMNMIWSDSFRLLHMRPTLK
jgi:caa(3)-type oxidase subunit IV